MNGQRGTILFLDDEPSILSALRRTLRKEEYRLFFCQTPQEAFDVLEREEVDLVFSDHLMPEMTGLEFIEVVKELWPHVMRCILTGQADMELVVSAINKGNVHRFLVKPWNNVELKITISQLFGQRALVQANQELNEMVEAQRGRIKRLEHEHPGISAVRRDPTGVIIVDIDEGELKCA
jgi:response regulator RpfG family c-di-GMP phosphodiesterase